MTGLRQPWISIGTGAPPWHPRGRGVLAGPAAPRNTWLEREVLRRLRRRRRAGWRLGVLLWIFVACATFLHVPVAQAPPAPAPAVIEHTGAGASDKRIPFRTIASPA